MGLQPVHRKAPEVSSHQLVEGESLPNHLKTQQSLLQCRHTLDCLQEVAQHSWAIGEERITHEQAEHAKLKAFGFLETPTVSSMMKPAYLAWGQIVGDDRHSSG